MPKESRVEIPSGSGNKYRYEYSDGQTIYRGPVGSAPDLGEAEFMALFGKPVVRPGTWFTEEMEIDDKELEGLITAEAGPRLSQTRVEIKRTGWMVKDLKKGTIWPQLEAWSALSAVSDAEEAMYKYKGKRDFILMTPDGKLSNVKIEWREGKERERLAFGGYKHPYWTITFLPRTDEWASQNTSVWLEPDEVEKHLGEPRKKEEGVLGTNIKFVP